MCPLAVCNVPDVRQGRLHLLEHFNAVVHVKLELTQLMALRQVGESAVQHALLDPFQAQEPRHVQHAKLESTLKAMV